MKKNCGGLFTPSSDKVIDPCLHKTGNRWKMWFKDEMHGSHTYAAESEDLDKWEVTGPEITDCPHEGPNVFSYGGWGWMITDPWEGLAVYRSKDFTRWERMENILREHGNRPGDNRMGQHADVAVFNNMAYIFYHTHPELDDQNRQNNSYEWSNAERRSVLQVAGLHCVNGILTCDRNEKFFLDLQPPDRNSMIA